MSDKEFFHITINSHQDIFDLRKEFGDRVEVISRDEDLPLLWTVSVCAEDENKFIEWCEDRNIDTRWNDYHITPDIIIVLTEQGYSFHFPNGQVTSCD